MSKHDTVIGYIEYLDSSGSVQERIPYVDAEKFKARIYDSLYCGEHIIPVVFPENLSQPLAFEKGTIFPWGLRSEKHELLPYEIYQTNNREIAFLRYDYTKDHINAASYKLVYRGQMECWQTLDSLYCLHNQENRPNGRKMRSLSVSDIIVTHEGGQAHAYEIFAVIHTTVQADAADVFPFYRFVDAATPEEFADYVSACKARALYDTGIFAEYGDKLLTLSTCDNITDNGRLLVIAKQTETE